MAQVQHTHSLPHLEEALTALFCFIDDANALLNPHHTTLRVHKAAFGLRDYHLRPLAAASGVAGLTLPPSTGV